MNASEPLIRARAAQPSAALARRALALVDLTSLNDDDTPEVIERLCRRARTPLGPVAAVCVYPRFVAQARRALGDSLVKVATVVNFPAGDADPAAVAEQTRRAIADGADEIDVVQPYRALQAGDKARVRAILEATRAACPDATLKVILESGALSLDEVRRASELAIDCGADFLKTSTGKIAQGASLEAALVMLEVIRRHGLLLGLKPAGGIRTVRDAAQYLALADAVMGPNWASPARFRFGASGLLEALLAELGQGEAGGPPSTY